MKRLRGSKKRFFATDVDCSGFVIESSIEMIAFAASAIMDATQIGKVLKNSTELALYIWAVKQLLTGTPTRAPGCSLFKGVCAMHEAMIW